MSDPSTLQVTQEASSGESDASYPLTFKVASNSNCVIYSPGSRVYCYRSGPNSLRLLVITLKGSPVLLALKQDVIVPRQRLSNGTRSVRVAQPEGREFKRDLTEHIPHK